MEGWGEKMTMMKKKKKKERKKERTMFQVECF